MKKSTVPPYISFQTFKTLLEDLKNRMPSHIDRSVWGSGISGSTCAQLIAALRYLELIDHDNSPLPELEQLVQSSGVERQITLKSILSRSYEPLFELDLRRATRRQLRQKFLEFGIGERVVEKSQRFFINAAREANISLSDHITKGLHGNTKIARSLKRPKKSENVVPQQNNADTPSDYFKVATLWLGKIPDFNPNWDDKAQQSWLNAMNSVQKRLEEFLRTAG